ncbi:hypothetical protein PVAP13_4KG342288 [Panicum virgatum]|uniref:Uncharacterized protein n=1 Tax=Panicum virgatum TaxID=38727 RepID=A0A8T0TZE6_PANVG|nr:hypothetical protein PVAP13_4KG342288 [Panicum virgatum]
MAAPDAYWNDFAPRIDGYNNVLAKAIAAGPGQLVRGIFMCSEAYASQMPVQSVLPSSEAIGEFLRMTDSLTLLFLAGSGEARLNWRGVRLPRGCIRFSGELISSVPRLPAPRATESAELAGAARRARSAER